MLNKVWVTKRVPLLCIYLYDWQFRYEQALITSECSYKYVYPSDKTTGICRTTYYTFTREQYLHPCIQETFISPCIISHVRLNRSLPQQFWLAQTYLGQSFVKLACYELEHIMIKKSYVISNHNLTSHVLLNNFQSRRTKQWNTE
jgi:hypothetical protein